MFTFNLSIESDSMENLQKSLEEIKNSIKDRMVHNSCGPTGDPESGLLYSYEFLNGKQALKVMSALSEFEYFYNKD